MRIKRSDLDGMVGRLNSIAGTVPCSEFVIDCSYGGYRLEQRSGAGVNDVSPRGTMRETYNFVWAMVKGIECQKKTDEDQFHERVFMVLDNDKNAFDQFRSLISPGGGYFAEDEGNICNLLDKLFDSIEIRPDRSLPQDLQEFRSLMAGQWISDSRHSINPYSVYCHFKYRK